MMDGTGSLGWWQVWIDLMATALYRSWGVAGEHATEGSAAPICRYYHMVDFVDSISLIIVDTYSTSEVVSICFNDHKYRYTPYVRRSSFPSHWQLFPAGAFAKRPRPLAALRTALRMLSFKTSVRMLPCAKLRNSEPRGEKDPNSNIASHSQNTTKYRHIQIYKKNAKHCQTVGYCTCGIFRWVICSAWDLHPRAQPPSPSPYLHLGTDPWFHLKCETMWNLRRWAIGWLSSLFFHVFSLHVKVIYGIYRKTS